MMTQCEGYGNLRGDADLENQEELVEFLSRKMDRRRENNWD